ncbi:MAG: hypothetical protein S0880_09830, partial [Actinomycetota bacterium]|nr:hypothetical protein [Actinomycetota bacterium]
MTGTSVRRESTSQGSTGLPTGRDAVTLGLYAALGCLGYVITGMGAILPVLRDEQGLTRGDVALYPFGFAAGLVIVGFVGDRVAARLGRVMLPVSLVGLASGASLL